MSVSLVSRVDSLGGQGFREDSVSFRTPSPLVGTVRSSVGKVHVGEEEEKDIFREISGGRGRRFV